MKYRIGPKGFPCGQFFVPASELIDLTKNPDDYSTWEQLLVGKVPDPSAVALDADCAVAMWRGTHPELRRQLMRRLDSFNEETFQRLLAMDEATLERHWPRGKA